MSGGASVTSLSRTRATNATSSGDAEYQASVKAATEGLGLQAVALGLGWTLKLTMWADSSAVVAMAPVDVAWAKSATLG